jgi:hypothetical protein
VLRLCVYAYTETLSGLTSEKAKKAKSIYRTSANRLSAKLGVLRSVGHGDTFDLELPRTLITGSRVIKRERFYKV